MARIRCPSIGTETPLNRTLYVAVESDSIAVRIGDDELVGHVAGDIVSVGGESWSSVLSVLSFASSE